MDDKTIEETQSKFVIDSWVSTIKCANTVAQQRIAEQVFRRPPEVQQRSDVGDASVQK